MNLKFTTTNGFNFWKINPLMGSWRVRLTWLDCNGPQTSNVWPQNTSCLAPLLEHVFCLLFTLRCNHGYKPSTKRLPSTFLIYWHLPNQPTKTTSIACFLVCKFFIRGKKMQTHRLKRLLSFFSTNNKTVATITFNFLWDSPRRSWRLFCCSRR